MSSGTVLHSFSRFLPERIVTNDELSQRMDTSDEWIYQRSGIKERRWVEAPTTTSDLGTEAARRSLAMAKYSDVDAIIAASLSPDYDFPGIGVLIQNKLGLGSVPAFDIRNQCSGFLYSIELANALIAAGQYRRILIVGAEVHSTGLDISTRGRDIAVLFGDGAGSCSAESAATWAQADRRGLEILSTELHGDGAHVEELWCEHIGSAHFPTRVTQDLIDEAKIFPKMNGKKVFEHAVKRMTEVSHSVLARAGQSAAQVNWFVPHQANLRINSMVASQLGLREAAAINTITHYGNTTAATIPIGMSHLFEEHELKVDELVLSAAFGAGFTWGAALLRVV